MDNIEYYNGLAGAHPPLELVEERALMARIASTRDDAVKNQELMQKLVCHNLGVAIGMAVNRARRGGSFEQVCDDAISVTVGALFEAARTVEDVGTPFLPHAIPLIKRRLSELFRSLPMVTISRYGRERAKGKHSQHKACSNFAGLVGSATAMTRSLDDLVNPHQSDPTLLHEIIPSEEPAFTGTVDDGIDLSEGLKCLDERELLVVKGFFGLDGEAQTYIAISAKTGLTPQRTQQICAKALEKMRAFLVRRAPAACYHKVD